MDKTNTGLTARDVYQLLKDIALETRSLNKVNRKTSGQIEVEADGWHLTLVSEDDRLSHCQVCQSPDQRRGTADAWQRYGTDPVKLLSTWEHEQLQRLLGLSPDHE